MPNVKVTTQSLDDLEGCVSDISDFVDKADFVALMPNVEGETSRQKLKELAARMYLTFTHKAAYNPVTTSAKAFQLLSVVAVLGAAEELSSRVVQSNTRFSAFALEHILPTIIPKYSKYCEAGVCGASPNCSLQKFCSLMVRLIGGMRSTYRKNKGLGYALIIKRAVEAGPPKEEEKSKDEKEDDEKGDEQDEKKEDEQQDERRSELESGDSVEEVTTGFSFSDFFSEKEEPVVTFHSFLTSVMAGIKAELEPETEGEIGTKTPKFSIKEKIDIVHKHLCKAFEIALFAGEKAKKVAYMLCDQQNDGSPFYQEHGPLLFVVAGLDSISNAETRRAGFKPFFAGFCTFSLEQLKDQRRVLNKLFEKKGRSANEPYYQRDDATMPAFFGSRQSRAAIRDAAKPDSDLTAFWAWKMKPFDLPETDEEPADPDEPILDLKEYDVYKS